MLGSVTVKENKTYSGTVVRVAEDTSVTPNIPASVGYDAVELSDLVKSVEVSVTHGILEDPAVNRLSLHSPGGATGVTQNITSGNLDGDTASISVPDARLGGDIGGTHMIRVHFTGEEPISSWPAGSADVSYVDAQASPTTGRVPATDTTTLPPGASGDLASFTRGGLSATLNMAQSTSGDGATRYQSWVRISNNGAGDGSVTVTVYDSATGDYLGHWDSPTIPAGGSIQVSAKSLEDHLGYTPSAAQQYDLKVEGDINGYVQHVMWNAVDGLFSDLSGFRSGGGLNTTP